jgi:DNA repair exonuclease SbcCD ATPase subunit
VTFEEITQIKVLETLINEHDKGYRELFAMQEKSVTTAFTASEKAIVKQEEQQRTYNENFKIEVMGRFQLLEDKIENLRKDINGLRESRSGQESAKTNTKELGAYIMAAVSILIAIALHFWH